MLLHEGVTPTDATSYNACTGVSGAGLAIAQNLSPKIDAVVSGHTHQAYNCVVKDPKGNPRLFTSASSFGRMVTKLHFLIDPKTHDIVRPAAFAENIINASSSTDKQSTKMNKLISTFKTLVAPIAERGHRPPRSHPASARHYLRWPALHLPDRGHRGRSGRWGRLAAGQPDRRLAEGRPERGPQRPGSRSSR